tara:strand:+ start:7244 stop:8278 length:1035 start_codon:yes stop_codon:yes gene_type:complete
MRGKFTNKTRSTERNRSAKENIVYGEVIDVIVNSDHEEYREPQSLGDIKIKMYGGGQDYQTNPDKGYKWIKLLRRDIQTLPLIGEMVIAIMAPGLKAQDNPRSFMYYYLSNISAWGERNEHTIPNASFSSKEHYLNDVPGETFEEVETSPLHPFEGDVILQGRFDNSIRFGSTVAGAKTIDSWSVGGGSPGDPIMIITNQFAAEGSDKIEDINADKSTIMMTSTQKIDIGLASSESPESVAVPTGPVVPMQPLNTYMDKPQIIISSDRLIFNAKADHVLISAAKEISLSTSAWKINVTALADILLETLNQLTMEVHPTPAGPSGPPINAPIYAQLMGQLMAMKQ